MRQNPLSDGGTPRLHIARAKYLTAYVLLSHATAQLEKLSITRGAYKRTRRSIVRAAAIVMLVAGMLGLATPRVSHATPVFSAPVADPFGAGLVWGSNCRSAPSLVDIDGDGDLDLFLGCNLSIPSTFKYSGVAFFENTGTASIPDFSTGYNVTAFGFSPSSYLNDALGNTLHDRPAFVDIDGDGDLDFFLQNAYLYGTNFWQNGGTPLAPTFATAALPTGMASPLAGNANTFVDIDGDGDFDLFSGYYDGTVNFQENVGTALAASFDPVVSNPFGLSSLATHPAPAFADIDGDGDFDAFLGKYDGGIRVQLNNGTPLAPAFGVGQYNPFGLTSNPNTLYASPALADIDDDGDLDLFVGTKDTVDFASHFFFYENVEINCGDGIIDPSETCDGINLGGDTCTTLGYDSGALACAPDCLSFNTSACVGLPCPPTPSGGCLAPGKAQFQLKTNADPAKKSLKFKWQKGATFAQAMLGNPAATTDTALCIYDETATVPALVGRVSVPANAFWVDKDPKGFQMVDKTGTYDGVTKVQLKTGDPGKTSASLQAKGVNLTLPPAISVTEYFDQDTDVTVQLRSEAGICWSADFTAAGTSKNDAVQFKAKNP